MRVSPFLSLPFLLAQALADAPEGRTAAQAVKEGNKKLAEGAYNDAVRVYSEAIGEYRD